MYTTMQFIPCISATHASVHVIACTPSQAGCAMRFLHNMLCRSQHITSLKGRAVVRTCCGQWTDSAVCPSGPRAASWQHHWPRKREQTATAADLNLVDCKSRVHSGLQTAMGDDIWPAVGPYSVMLLLAPGFCKLHCLCWIWTEPSGGRKVSGCVSGRSALIASTRRAAETVLFAGTAVRLASL